MAPAWCIRRPNAKSPSTSIIPAMLRRWCRRGLMPGIHTSKPGESKVPFVLTPPLFRLDPTKVQSLRLVYTHDPLPQDRESLYWLNVLDIPPRAAANPDLPQSVGLAFKHRMKVFFRPARLAGLGWPMPPQIDVEAAVQGRQARGNPGEQPDCLSCLADPGRARPSQVIAHDCQGGYGGPLRQPQLRSARSGHRTQRRRCRRILVRQRLSAAA